MRDYKIRKAIQNVKINFNCIKIMMIERIIYIVRTPYTHSKNSRYALE